MEEITLERIFDFVNLSAFALGIFLGMLIAGIFYMILVLKAIRKSNNLKIPIKSNRHECYEMVQKAKRDYKKRKRKYGPQGRFLLTRDLAERLAYEIARHHYPDSRQPFLEISTYEILETAKYIIMRIEGILDRKPLNKLKGLSGLEILTMFEFTEKVTGNKTLKGAIKVNNSAVVKTAKSVWGVINPALLVRRTVMNTTINLSVDVLCLVVLNIVGEEVYKLYSKELFKMEDTDLLLTEGVEEDGEKEQEDISNSTN